MFGNAMFPFHDGSDISKERVQMLNASNSLKYFFHQLYLLNLFLLGVGNG
jgi:hypothetical protein